jgi:hypothetical protein
VQACPVISPFRCASGTCVSNPLQCPIISSCDPLTQFRCGNGMCMNQVNGYNPCPVANTCPWNADRTVQMQRCFASGLCVLNYPIDCVTSSSSSCPGAQKKCPTGLCTANGLLSDPGCQINNGQLQNGCPLDAPEKCIFSGSCVANASTMCTNLLGCLPATPYLCSTGVCVADPAVCQGICVSQTVISYLAVIGYLEVIGY